MVTNLKAGMEIRVAVPISPQDNTPFAQRKEFRKSRIEELTDEGIVHETEGNLLASRLGIDFELADAMNQEPGVNLCVVSMKGGPILATFLRASGNTVELYSEQTIPPGIIVTRGTACGKHWDWLKGRTVGEAFKTLTDVFEPNGKTKEPEESQVAPPTTPAGKKRGPKPKPPKTDQPTSGPESKKPDETTTQAVAGVSASDGQLTFLHRMRLWHAASDLVRLLESNADDLRVNEAASTVYAVVANVAEECRHG